LFLDLAKRSRMFGIQGWLSFYYRRRLCPHGVSRRVQHADEPSGLV